MDYAEALEYLDSFVDYEKQESYDYNLLGLERIERLLELLGNPESGIRAIQVAGTKGKGSTCAFASSILRETGFKVGLYTSPHLISLRERIRVLGPQFAVESLSGEEGMISEEEICELVTRMKPYADALRDDPKFGSLTFFEAYTALAFLHFRTKKVDFMVLETGLGGRLDATNVVKALVCGITPISLEHTDKLGNRLKEIAGEKSGIIKNNISHSSFGSQIVVTAPQKKEALKVIKETCQRQNARLYEVNKNIFLEELSFDQEKQVFNLKGIFAEYPRLAIKLLGGHQILNAATAVAMVEALRFQDIFVLPDAIKKGLENTRWPGRLETLEKNPLIVLDGAQNRESAAILKKAIKGFFNYEKLILILGLSKDKDITGVFHELAEISNQLILTRASSPRAAEPEVIRECIGKDATLTNTVGEALEEARRQAKKEDLILVTGSLFVVGEARACLVNDKCQ